MARYKITFKLTVMTPDSLVYENEVESVFLTGDRGEYEVLPYHYPVLGILKRGSIIVDWKESIRIKSGLIRFFANDCIILIEPDLTRRKVKEREEEIAYTEEKDN